MDRTVSVLRPALFGIFGILALGLLLAARPAPAADCEAIYGPADAPVTVRLATGSPGELGLLEALHGAFAPEGQVALCWVKAGSGESLKLLKGGDVDMVMVHAPAAEKQAVADGWADGRNLIGSNEFYIVGPAEDPAGIRDATSAADAYARIAKAQAPFITRNDNSGTHKKELDIWKKAEIQPSGDWYIPSNTFMTASLLMAAEKNGYFMTDSSTWVAAKNEVPTLAILYRGDPMLINTYHTLYDARATGASHDSAVMFVEFVASPGGQKVIGTYGADQYGEGLYNDAAYAKQYDH